MNSEDEIRRKKSSQAKGGWAPEPRGIPMAKIFSNEDLAQGNYAWSCALWVGEGHLRIAGPQDACACASSAIKANGELLRQVKAILGACPAPLAALHISFQFTLSAAHDHPDPLADTQLQLAFQDDFKLVLSRLPNPLPFAPTSDDPNLAIRSVRNRGELVAGQLQLTELVLRFGRAYPVGMKIETVANAEPPEDNPRAASPTTPWGPLALPSTPAHEPPNLGTSSPSPFSVERSYAIRPSSPQPSDLAARARAEFFNRCLSTFSDGIDNLVAALLPRDSALVSQEREQQARRSILLIAYREWVGQGASQSLHDVKCALELAATELGTTPPPQSSR